jgi:hypothetical protein
MRSIWKRKWIIAPVAVAIILAIGAVGAVALAGPGDQNATVSGQTLTNATGIAPTVATVGVQSTGSTLPGQALREARRARLQQRLEQLKQRWTQARAKMTPADQAAFDQLTQTAKDQRTALQKARADLKSTLKQMRGLVQKYRPQSTTPTTAPSVQVQ